MYALRTCPFFLKSCAFRSTLKQLPSIRCNSTAQAAVQNQLASKRRNPRFWRNVFLFNGLLFGAGAGYYSFQMTPKQRRQVKVTFEGIQRAFRSFRIGVVIAAEYKYLFWTIPDTDPRYEEALKACHQRAAARISQGCIDNGGLYVKMGQGLVTADHIAPREYIDGLRVLLDRALRRQRNEVSLLIREEFGCDVSDIFSYLSPEPIAAASLAEVYDGRLKKTGERVAVKLQYIDLQDRFVGDMLTIRMILYALGKLFPKFDFGWMLESVTKNLENELNFKLEGENAERCYAQLSPYLKYIYVPRVIWEYTSRRVLVMEFIEGLKVSDVEKIKRSNLSLKEIDAKIVEAMAFQIFHSGFVHADPHPGNIYVRQDPNTPNRPNAQIVLLDHGLYESVGTKEREALCLLWKSIVLKDEEKMKKYAIQLGVQEKDYLTFSLMLSMRPIHRPIHEMAVLPEVWDKMSPAEQAEARAQGKLRAPSEKEFLAMSPEEKFAFRQQFSKVFDDIQESVLRTLFDMPRSLLLIFRNLNQIRSTIRDHGNLIDRHTIMARSAILGARKHEGLPKSWIDRIYARFALFYFDTILFKDRMERWFKFKVLKVLVYFGYIPAETGAMIEEFQ